MSELPEQESLLNDVLAEGVAPDLRDRLLGESFRLARRRRQIRHARHAGGMVAVLLAAGLLASHFAGQKPVRPLAPTTAVSSPYLLVRTQPLPEPDQVRTQPLSSAYLKVSTRSATIVTNSRTSSGSHVREIGDDELLTLAAPQGAVLVHFGPDKAELVLGPAGQDEPSSLQSRPVKTSPAPGISSSREAVSQRKTIRPR